MPAAPLGPDTVPFAVCLLGGLQVRRNGQLLPHSFRTRKTASLFAFLFLHPRARHSRRFLAGTFWPDVDEDAALQSLRAALVPIRRLLEPRPEQKGRFLVSQHDTLHLLPPPDCWVDVWAFEQAAAQAKHAPAGSAEWFALLERAVALYEGDLLPDQGEEWCAVRREELRQGLLACLHELTRADEQRHRLDRACGWARRALAADRCDEESHRHLMRLYHRLGEHARAIQQYRECCRSLREELDAAPDPETIALYQWLRPRPDREKWVPSWWETALLDLDLMGPLVGREREQDRLRAAWERARAGRGELLLLTGEAGIGKSRLGRQFLQEVALSGCLALYGQASALESSFLYRPLIDPLRRALELAAEHGLTLCAPVWLEQVARLLPELRQGEGGSSVAGEESPRLLEEGMAQLLLGLATQRPVCLFLDDLHWADAATGRFLHYLAHQSRQARILLIGAYREGEVTESDWLGPWLTEVEARQMAASLPLARLNEEEVERLLEQLAEGQASKALLRPLGRRLHEETEGNPLFLLVTVRELFDRGYLVVNEKRRWQLTSLAAPGARLQEPGSDEAGGPAASLPGAWNLEPGAAPEGRLPLPAIVQRVVRQRVGRLREEERQLLQCAAVIGRRFTFAALQRAMGQDVEAMLAGVERLLAADLIRVEAHPPAFDFRHDKIREVVYEDMVAARRQEWHRRVGEALEAIYGVADAGGIEEKPLSDAGRRPLPAAWVQHAEELARHFQEAAPLIGPEKAVYYYTEAAARARALCAYEQAVKDLLMAKSLLAEFPLDGARLAQLGEIVNQLAPALRGLDRRQEARAVLEEHVALCELHGYAPGIARGCTYLGRFLYFERPPGWLTTVQALYERAIAVCEAHGVHDWIVYPQSRLAFVLAEAGTDLERAEEAVRACVRPVEAHPDPVLRQRVCTALMWIATRRADWAAVRKAFHASLASGGPLTIPLSQILQVIEETCRRTGAEETFIELCREIAEGYTRAGLEAPLQQWYLEPTSPPATTGEPAIREEFVGETWHPELAWQDATGRSRADRAIRPGWLGLHPAEGSDLWPERDLNAPRLMATVRGDFVAQCRVELGQEASVFAGLLVWQDEQHFARLELRAEPGTPTTIHLQAFVAGIFRSIGRGRWERRPTWLAMERVGEELRGLCSADGAHWLACGTLRLPQGETEKVGLAVIWKGPGAFAWFDTFLLWGEVGT